jgi:cation transporter-like permease
MAHTSGSSFFKTLRETLIAYLFNIGGLFAGFLVASQLGIFQMSPWTLALYPAVIGAKSVIEGLLSGRLSTALHLGFVRPQFSGNTRSFYKLLEAVIVLTLITSVAMSAISLVFGHLFWGITFADFPAILSVVVATMAIGLTLIIVTVKVAFISFKKGLDPDIMVYPVMSAVATIVITLCYVATLNLFFSYHELGRWTTALLGITHFALVLYIFPRNLHEPDFTKTIRESLAALMIVALIVNITGTIFRGIGSYVRTRGEIYIIYPALIGLVSDVGSVVGSTATTKLALGMLKPKLSSIKNHAQSIFSAWLPSVAISVLLAGAALLIHGNFAVATFYNLTTIVLLANVIAVLLIVFLSFAISIVAFQKGLDPGNFVIPIGNSFAASITSVALLVALVFAGIV